MHSAMCRAFFSLAAALLSTAAHTQSAFDPEPMAYVLCITNETKRLALVNPPVAKDTIVEQSFRACGEEEKQIEKLVAERPIAALACAFAVGIVVGIALRRP